MNRKLNVVHICDKFGMRGSTIHGVSRLFAWWFPRFNRDRYNVTLYAVKNPDSSSQALEADGVEMTYLGKSAFNPSTLTSFMNVIRREKADVVHVHGWIAANFGRIAGKLTGVPTIMHEHGVDPKFPFSQRTADRLLAPFTHTALAVSKSVQDFLIQNRSVRPNKIKLIYNGAPLSEFSPADPESVVKVREEFGIPAGSRVVGAIGRIDVQKGLVYLIDAARQILELASDVHFLIIGDGPKKEELENEVRELGLDANFRFTGHRTDVPVIQTMLDVQVFPSLWEGTPLTVFEAMAMGRAIVSTNVDGLGEVLSDKENALIVEPANPMQLARAILSILSDSRLADSLQENAKESSRNYDIDNTVRNLELLYEELYGAGTR